MKLGIVGLPNVGKSTLFNSLTKAGAESANYPFCTIDPNVGVVTVPDERLNVLGEMYHTKKIIPAAIEFVDIAGLVKGASKGEGLGNQFLANIREVDAIVHVVRCFENSNIVHVDGSINPLRDIETINLELIFSDLEILERRISKVSKVARNDKSAAKELALLNKIAQKQGSFAAQPRAAGGNLCIGSGAGMNPVTNVGTGYDLLCRQFPTAVLKDDRPYGSGRGGNPARGMQKVEKPGVFRCFRQIKNNLFEAGRSPAAVEDDDSFPLIFPRINKIE